MTKKNIGIVAAALGLIIGIFIVLQFVGKNISNSSLVKNCNHYLPNQKVECEELAKKISNDYFSTSAPLMALEPTRVGAAITPLDSKMKFVISNDPHETTRIAYCYFVQRKWFDSNALPPDKLSLAVDGFAMLASEISDYLLWQNSVEGKECAKKVLQSTGLPVRNLAELIGERKALILVNPIVGLIQKRKVAEVIDSIRTTLNHERVHVLQLSCESLQLLAERLWDEMKPEQKKQMAKAHPGYDWKNKMIAQRENFAFFYENSLSVLLSDPGTACKW